MISVSSMTEQNLKNAFSGESQAHMRYLIFSDIAQQERFPEIARLFRAIANAEQVHSTNHFRILSYLKGGFITIGMAGFGPGETAKFQKENEAARSFEWAYDTEKVHAGMFQKARQAVGRGQDLEIKKIQICEVCGYTIEGDAPDRCPLCKATKDKFKSF